MDSSLSRHQSQECALDVNQYSKSRAATVLTSEQRGLFKQLQEVCDQLTGSLGTPVQTGTSMCITRRAESGAV